MTPFLVRLSLQIEGFGDMPEASGIPKPLVLYNYSPPHILETAETSLICCCDSEGK